MLLHSIYNRNTNEEVLKHVSNRICYLGFDDDYKHMIIRFEKRGTLLPGEESFSSLYKVWIESTIRISGFISSAVATTSDKRVSERINSSCGATPNRSARSFS